MTKSTLTKAYEERHLGGGCSSTAIAELTTRRGLSLTAAMRLESHNHSLGKARPTTTLRWRHFSKPSKRKGFIA